MFRKFLPSLPFFSLCESGSVCICFSRRWNLKEICQNSCQFLLLLVFISNTFTAQSRALGREPAVSSDAGTVPVKLLLLLFASKAAGVDEHTGSGMQRLCHMTSPMKSSCICLGKLNTGDFLETFTSLTGAVCKID